MAEQPLKKRKRRVILKSFGLLSLLLVLLLILYVVFWPQVKIHVGPDTTVLTGPLNPDGTVNYVAALNEKCSRGVTDDNNAAALLVRAFGPEAIGADSRAIVLAKLGVASLPANGDYLVDFKDWASTMPEHLGQRESNALLEKAKRRPWTRAEFPRLAEWLDKNANPLALVAEASRRPRCYMPMVSPSNPPQIIDILLPSLSFDRVAARALAARAMLRAGAGDVDGAWQDIMTIYRLARLVGENPTLIGQMVAVAIDNLASTYAQGLAGSGKLSADQVRGMLADLEKLPASSNVVEALDKAERFMILDAIAVLSRGGPVGQVTVQRGSFNKVRLLHVDWNKALRIANHHYDRIVEAGRKPFRERVAALATVDVEMDKELRGGWVRIVLRGPTHAVIAMFLNMMLPAAGQARTAEDQVEMVRQLTAVALALAASKADKGGYPEKLESLAPAYCKMIPADLFTGEPLKYRRTADGYLLYSVGPNQKDDGGIGPNTRDEAGKITEANRIIDDLAVRVGSAASQPEAGK